MTTTRRLFIATTATGLALPTCVFALGSNKPIDSELTGTVVCGYQGRFNVKGDGLGMRFRHYDVAWCKDAGIHYLSVIFPGLSWHSMKKAKGEKRELNKAPRREGAFLWAQAEAARKAKAESLSMLRCLARSMKAP